MSEIEVNLAAADVERIALAIAQANGHSDAAAYAASVVSAWTALAPEPPKKEG